MTNRRRWWLGRSRCAAQGFGGVKIKVGRPHLSEDVDRLAAVREAVGSGMDIMVDANQGLTSARPGAGPAG